jgi:hypothetical protein
VIDRSLGVRRCLELAEAGEEAALSLGNGHGRKIASLWRRCLSHWSSVAPTSRPPRPLGEASRSPNAHYQEQSTGRARWWCSLP